MICTCAFCGFEGFVFDYQSWSKYGAKYPDLYICDICYMDAIV